VKAGATEVIVASGTVAKGIGKLLGVSKETRFGGVLDDSGVAVKLRDMAFPLYPPVAKGSGKILSDIAEEIDSDRDKNEMRKLFKLFSTSLSLNDDGKVKLSELTNEILRTSKGVMNDDDIREMLGCDSDQKDCFEQDRYVTFSEFVTLYKQNLLLSQK
jgi:Ca2+-binding EF-hand superfamily protein